MARLSFTGIMKKLCSLIIVLLIGTMSADAQSRSKIQGTASDAQTGGSLPGVNVVVMGTNLGAVTDLEGRYFIVNVPVGTYNVRASMIGYTPVVVKEVIVSIERVATVDFTLESTEIKTGEVIVVAQRNEMHREVSGTQMVATSGEIINVSGIREINAFLEKLPGMSVDVNGFMTIRGGTADQVGTLVNGLAYNNAAVGNSETSVPLSSIDQISVLSGGYNAEYGNFRSGLINITTKSGSLNGYHGTVNISGDQSHMRRFGNSMYDPKNPILTPYLDPAVSFRGTYEAWADDPYKQQQHSAFIGWDSVAATYNAGKPLASQASPLELYLLTSWMTMTVPDYAGLEKAMAADPKILGIKTKAQADSMLNATRNAFLKHANHETGSDYNLDAGFGGPVPLVGKLLGDATFYASNNTRSLNFIQPVTLNNDFTSTSLLTIKSTPAGNVTLTVNGLWKREIGISPIRPASGDFPDVSSGGTGRGGFMQQNNINYIYDNTGIVGDNYSYLYDQAYFPILNQTTVMTGLTFNHLLSPTTYYEVTLSRLSISDHSPVGDNRDTTMITQIGPFNLDESPYGKWQWAGNHRVQGFTFPSYDAPPGITQMRFARKEGDLHDMSKTYQYAAKFDVSSQLGDHNYAKAGFEYNKIDLDHVFYELWNSNAYNTYEFNYHEKPSQTAFYLQDQVNYEGIVANLGVRLDYYYGGGGVWPSSDSAYAYSSIFLPQDTTDLFSYLQTGRSQIWHFWQEYNETHPGFLQPVKNFFAVSPRLGLSFPVTERSKFYFNYGHFRSNPPYYSMYQFQYRYTKNGLYKMSNPNLEPPRTIQYELGVEYNVIGSVMMRVSGYYKDVTGQQGQVTYVSSDGTINYRGYLNNQYQSIQGVEVNLSKNDNSWINGWLNFNYSMRKTGNTGIQTITQVPVTDQSNLYQGNETPTLPSPRLNGDLIFRSPLNWGPQPAGLNILGNWTLTLFGEWRSGSYFTWNPLNDPHVSNNLQWPGFYRIDLKLNKELSIAGLSTSLYVDVTNVFNIKVNLMGIGHSYSSSTPPYAFSSSADESNYLASLHLPMYNSHDYDALRYANPGLYIPGNDRVGDFRSDAKPYVNDPDYADLYLYGQPRDIWLGIRIDF